MILIATNQIQIFIDGFVIVTYNQIIIQIYYLKLPVRDKSQTNPSSSFLPDVWSCFILLEGAFVNITHHQMCLVNWSERSACASWGNKVAIILVIISLSPRFLLILTKGVVLGFWNFAWGFKSPRNMILGHKIIGDLNPSPLTFNPMNG